MCLFRAPSFALCDCAHFTPVFWFQLRWLRNAEWKRRIQGVPPFRCTRRQTSGLWLTAGADATGQFRCGIATLASSKSSITTQSGDDTASAEHTIAQAERDPATIQPVANATHGLDTYFSQGRRHHWHNTSETQPREHAACATPSSQSYILNTGKGRRKRWLLSHWLTTSKLGKANTQPPVRTTYHR